MPPFLRNRLRNVLVWIACCAAGLGIAQLMFHGRWLVSDVLAESVNAWNNKLLAPTRSPDDHSVRLIDLGAPATDASQIIDLLDLLNYARAKAVLLYLDIDRLTRNDATQEAALAAAIRRYASVVLVQGAGGDLGEWRLPPAVRNAAAAVGHRHYLSTVNRSVQGVVTTPAAPPGESETHGLLSLLQVADPSARRAVDDAIRRAADADGAASLRLPYASAPGQFPGPPVGSLSPGAPELRDLRGKVIVIGSTGENPMVTPYDSLSARHPQGRRMSEAEVGANYAAALLKGRVMRAVSPAQSRVIVPLTVLACALPLLLLSPLAGYVASFVLGAATLPAWWYAAQERLIVFDDALQATAAVLVTGFLWIAVSLWRSRRNADQLLDQLRSVRLPMRLADVAPIVSPARHAGSLEVAQAAIDAARANQALTAAVIDSLPVALVLVDGDGRVLAANQRTSQWFGRDDPVGRHVELLLRQFEFYGTGDAHRLLHSAQHKAEARGDGRDWLIDSRLVDGGARGGIRMLGIQDVSLVKQAVNDRADAVDFLTHDLRTPLHSILVLTGLLEREAPAPHAPAGTMQQIRHMTERAIRLADNYVHLLRTDGATAAAFVEVNLNDVIEEAIATSQPLALERRVVVRQLGSPLCFVRGDYALLFRALVNVLGNAVRHSPPGSSIQVELETTAEEVAVVVRDEGSGFPGELLGRNIDRYRVGKQPKAQGIGLGLALVDAVARKHGGALQLSNRMHGGGEARIVLPLYEQAAPTRLRLAS